MEAAVDAAGRQLTLAGVGHTYAGQGGAVEALAPTDLRIDAGEFVVVVGPSGCGKTTLLRLLAGFERPTVGRIGVGDRTVTGPDPDRGFVFQRPALYPWLSVAGNVELGLRLRGVPRGERARRARHHLALVGLADFADAAPYELSGGMQQRCQLARVLATEPAVLLMDEPFGALDALTREHLQGELRRVWNDGDGRSGVSRRRTVVFVTHSVEEAVVLGTRVLVMSPRPGRIVLDLALPFADRDVTTRELRTDPDVVATAERLRAALNPPGGASDGGDDLH
ncbi:MAG TPA: ABC transporter ATP-binding protein [Iamia sp.]|nr:ABC transporter ATP-binding protein [Iamia sp.]